MWEVLRKPEIPVCLRICAGTDGSVTLLLELLTGKSVEVKTIKQSVVKATPDMAELLEIDIGDEVNNRLVTLTADDMVFVLAKSLSPLKRMPEPVRSDLTQADIPIGRILREHRIETRRDILNIDMIRSDFFKGSPVLSREYKIIYMGKILMWINECFPVDRRWEM